MIIEYVRYELPAELRADFEISYQRVGHILSESPHCLRWELARSTDEPESYSVRIEWDSAEGHLVGFRESSAFPTFLGELKRYAPYRRQMAHFVALQGSSVADS